jgi:hypothetical protein
MFKLQLEAGQSPPVQAELDFPNRQVWHVGGIGLPKPDILGHDAFVKPEAQTGELQIHTALTEALEQRILYEPGEADLIQIKQAAQQDQDKHPNSDSKPPEVHPARTPESAALAFGFCAHRIDK